MTSNARLLLLAGSLLLSPPFARGALPAPAACTGAPGSGAVTCDLWAKVGAVAVPGSPAVPIWGYADTAAGPAQLPGPTIVAAAGDTLTVNLHNTLGEVTALIFPGQDQAAGGPEAAPGTGTASYALPALRPGTYLYQAGPVVHDVADPTLVRGAQHQAAMGLFGALVVRPLAAAAPPATGQAYEDPATAFADEALLVLSELDPLFAAAPATFDLRNYSPRWRLINGKAFPATDPIPATAGATTLLRYLNAGLQHHSMALLGLDQSVVGLDGSALSMPRRSVAEMIAPGQTVDALVAVPATAPAGGQVPLYDGSLMLVNSSGTGALAGFGGMLTFLNVGSGTPPATGPAVLAVSVSPSPTATTGTVALSAVLGAGATAAEYSIDTLAAAGSGTPFDPAGAPVDVSLLASGSHNVYVRATDGTTWGGANFAVLVIDRVGPAIAGLVLSPAVSGGTVPVAVSATADDRGSGSAAIAAAELTVQGYAGAPLAVTVSPAGSGPVAALTATIPAGLAAGTHDVSLRAQDALGNWGAPATATLTVDAGGPTLVGSPTAAPNPANGVVGLNSNTPAVRVTATFTDAAPGVAAAEGFLDPVGAPPEGSGFLFAASDGAFGGTTETAFADIPNSTIVQLAEGSHTISVRARDGAGNWGTLGSMTLVVDKTAPAIASLSAAPNPTNTTAAPFSNNATFTLSATGSDPSGLAGGEWWEGADPGRGLGRPMSGTGPVTAAVDFMTPTPWTAGTHTLNARVRDAAGNWSSILSTTVEVVLPDALFSNGFESGASPWGWTSATGPNLSVVPTPGGFPASAGAQVLRVALGGGAGARYLTDASPIQETGYHARFWFHPNGSLPNNTATPTLLAGLDAANATILQVQYRRQGTAAAGFTYQVRAGALSNAGAMANTAWVTIPAASASPVEIAWRAANAGAPARLILTANGTTVTANPATGNRRLEAVRLGLPAGLGGLGAATGAVYLDAFVSTRRSTIGP